MGNKIKFTVEIDAETGFVFVESNGRDASCEHEYTPGEFRKSVIAAVSNWIDYYLGV